MKPEMNGGDGTRGPRTDHGFTLIELVVVVSIVVILISIAIPALLRARVNADETAAIGSLRAINSAQVSYSVSAGRSGYAARLATLAAACPGASRAFISPDLGSDPVVKSGYRVTLQAAAGFEPDEDSPDCHGTPTHAGYYSTAVPVAAGISGRRAFASSSSVSIFVDNEGVAPTEAAMAPGGGGQVVQ